MVFKAAPVSPVPPGVGVGLRRNLLLEQLLHADGQVAQRPLGLLDVDVEDLPVKLGAGLQRFEASSLRTSVLTRLGRLREEALDVHLQRCQFVLDATLAAQRPACIGPAWTGSKYTRELPICPMAPWRRRMVSA
jgi:hypothetical protein